jgi:septal ring factor EnvC (AmiA/AmiB activator)
MARVDLTLAPHRRAGGRIVAMVLLVAASFAAGFGADELAPGRSPIAVVAAPVVAAPSAELGQLRQQLEQARMAMRVADARSQELERQIDALNQKLTESQDELTFFRKAREGKKH